MSVAARGPSAGWLGLLATVAVGCYLNSLSGALIYDDLNAIVRNPAVVELDPVRIARTASWFVPNGEFDRTRTRQHDHRCRRRQCHDRAEHR